MEPAQPATAKVGYGHCGASRESPPLWTENELQNVRQGRLSVILIKVEGLKVPVKLLFDGKYILARACVVCQNAVYILAGTRIMQFEGVEIQSCCLFGIAACRWHGHMVKSLGLFPLGSSGCCLLSLGQMRWEGGVSTAELWWLSPPLM